MSNRSGTLTRRTSSRRVSERWNRGRLEAGVDGGCGEQNRVLARGRVAIDFRCIFVLSGGARGVVTVVDGA